jgi:mannobiose 2-epimerase
MKELELAVRNELTENILPFWVKYGRDEKSGGFYGYLGNDNVGDSLESRSVVMTSRHLWTYSLASRVLKDPSHLAMADYAYRALTRDFIDTTHGGVFWSVKPDGSPDVSKKQIYGEGFALYAFSEYAIALKEVRGDGAGSSAALAVALSLYTLLEEHARERKFGGYVEARARDWKPTADLKLSDKDIDCAKSMNTNLHVMEAFTAFHRALKVVRPVDATRPENAALIARVEESLSSLIVITVEKILGKDFHLDLYFNDDWTQIGDIVSYGHDIETSWLLWEAIEELGAAGHELAKKYKPVVVKIAEVALEEGTDPETGAMENELHGGHKERTRIWWCQAEALVGYFNAWQMTGDKKFLDAAMRQWKWIEEKQRDAKKGDWFWAVAPDGTPNLSEPKGGNWKASYHNGRCCMELMKRIGAMNRQ